MYEKKTNFIDRIPFEDDEIKEILIIFSKFSDKQKIIFVLFVQFDSDISFIADYYDCSIEKIQRQIKKSINSLQSTNPEKWQHAMILYNKYESNENSPKLRKYKLRQRIHAKLVRFTWLQRIIIACCVAVVIYSTVITGKALYTFGLAQIEHEKYSDISVNSNPDQENLEFIETLYLPGYIPDGYKLLEQSGIPYENHSIRIAYISSIGDEIILKQSVSDSLNDLDNENISSWHININQNQGIYQEKENFKTLVWTEKGYFYSLWCNSPNIKKLELKKIAESLTEVSYEKD